MKVLKHIIMCVAALTTLFPAEAQNEYWHQRVSLFDLLPVYQDDIVFLGNSITDGGEFSELFEMPNIKNRGISSDVIDGVEKRLDQVFRNHPKKCFLLIGINDVSHHLGVERLSEKYEQLVKKIREMSPDTRLYIQSVMPVNNDFKRYKNLIGEEKTIVEFNKRIQKIAEENNAVYIDLWPALADPKTGKLRKKFTNDGLHLKGAGYKAWAAHIRPFVEE